MFDNALTLIVGYLLPTATALVALVWGRPSIANVKFGRDVYSVRDRIIDSIIDGYVDPDAQRVRDLIRFCDYLIENGQAVVRFSNFSAISVTLQRHGTTSTEFGADAHGGIGVDDEQSGAIQNARMRVCEADLQHAIAWFVVRNSAFWWVFAPLQIVSRLTARLRGRSGEVKRTSIVTGHLPPEIRLPGDFAGDLYDFTRQFDVAPPARHRGFSSWARDRTGGQSSPDGTIHGDHHAVS